MNLDELARVLWQDLRAWWRGEHRIVPRFDVNGRVTRGRIYARRNEPEGTMSAKTRLKGRMSLRVFRAATGQWEDPIDAGPIEVEER